MLIHIHDIFLPFEYPKHFVDKRRGWTEQYLLHGLLLNNADYEILWPAYYMWQVQRQTVLNTISVEKFVEAPASFWIRKVEIADYARG